MTKRTRPKPKKRASEGDNDWRREYARLLLSRASDHKSLQLRAQHLPAKLYRLQSLSDPTKTCERCQATAARERSFEHLENLTTWLAAASSFNDPYDSHWTFTITEEIQDLLVQRCYTADNRLAQELRDLLRPGCPREEVDAVLTNLRVPDAERQGVHDYIAAFPDKAHSKMHDELGPLIQRGLKVVCFTPTATSVAMWAHYAASHTGFCLEYATETLPEAIRADLHPVVYDSRRFDVTEGIIARLRDNADISRYAFASALYKAPEWSYEREWRAVLMGSDPTSTGMLIQMVKPSAVYAGTRMHASHRERLQSICTTLGVPLRNVRLSRTNYTMVLDEE